MAENKFMTVNGGSTLPKDAAAKLQIHERVEIPTLPEGWERKVAPDAETGDMEAVLPQFEREVPPDPKLQTIPGSTTDPKAAQSKLDKEMEQLRAEEKAQDDQLKGVGL